jgi:hypothetical protein
MVDLEIPQLIVACHHEYPFVLSKREWRTKGTAFVVERALRRKSQATKRGGLEVCNPLHAGGEADQGRCAGGYRKGC